MLLFIKEFFERVDFGKKSADIKIATNITQHAKSGLVIRYDLHNYGKTTYGQIFHTIMSWLMTACVRSPVCLACTWILVQACQASVGTDVDGKSCFIDANW